jgi:hypothetical protein
MVLLFAFLYQFIYLFIMDLSFEFDELFSDIVTDTSAIINNKRSIQEIDNENKKSDKKKYTKKSRYQCDESHLLSPVVLEQQNPSFMHDIPLIDTAIMYSRFDPFPMQPTANAYDTIIKDPFLRLCKNGYCTCNNCMGIETSSMKKKTTSITPGRVYCPSCKYLAVPLEFETPDIGRNENENENENDDDEDEDDDVDQIEDTILSSDNSDDEIEEANADADADADTECNDVVINTITEDMKTNTTWTEPLMIKCDQCKEIIEMTEETRKSILLSYMLKHQRMYLHQSNLDRQICI